jgi:N-acetyl sugar amidotransferase
MPEMRYCVRCFMPSSRPRMTIDDAGVCGGCRVAENRPEVDYGQRVATLQEILAQAPHSDSPYDCIVAWSGGKDSSAIALRVREEFGLRPLLVTFSPLIPTVEGDLNRTNLLNIGFDSIMTRPNQDVSRHLARRFLIERGDPKVHWNAGVNSGPTRVAVDKKIPIVFYAEHGESEYGGRLLSQHHLYERDLTEVLEHQIGDDPVNWVSGSVAEGDLYPYEYPPLISVQAVGLRALYFGYFHHWDVTENYKYVSEAFPFQGNFRGRTYGTFTDYDSVDDVMDDLYYYMQYIKFGFGRCLRDAARMIQRGKLSREEAFGLIESYDGEFPEDTIDQCLDYLGMTRTEFNRVVDQHRSDWIWHMVNGEWKLRTPPTL